MQEKVHGYVHSVRIELAKLISVGTRITYQATGDAGIFRITSNTIIRILACTSPHNPISTVTKNMCSCNSACIYVAPFCNCSFLPGSPKPPHFHRGSILTSFKKGALCSYHQGGYSYWWAYTDCSGIARKMYLVLGTSKSRDRERVVT